MSFFENNLKTLTFVTRFLIKRELRFVFPLIFANYTRLRIERILKMQLTLKPIPDEALQIALNVSASPWKDHYIDSYSSVVACKDLVNNPKTPWFYVCCTSSLKKYKVTVCFTANIASNELVMSETTMFNVKNYLNVSNPDSAQYFIIEASDPDPWIAEEAGLSLIANPCECPEDLLDTLLHNYFSEARYLREHDVLSINIKKFAPSYLYLVSRDNFKEVSFKVKYLRANDITRNPRKGCFVLRGLTTVIQKSNVFGYLPQKYLSSAHQWQNGWLNKRITDCFLSNCPPLLERPLMLFVSCISPFIQTESFVDVRPVFLIKGPEGSGKSSLVKITAARMGLNLLNIDFSEIQSLTSAQTEAKLRIVLQNAKNCVPCILLLCNIQIFGKDAEGKEDERIISSFALELKNMFKMGTQYPLVVVATANNSNIPSSLQQIFIETIDMKNSSQGQRSESLEWLLRIKGFKNKADLSQVAAMCTDFVLADLNAIVLHAAKIRTSQQQTGTESSEQLTLTQDDFSKAHEYMQSRYSDWIGAPRVPKVHWEDIGGLADLKSEILRRIELPLLTADGIGLRRTGLLLYGPPGTGKTLLAKAVATECQVHFLSVKGPELLNMYVGQSEKNVRQVFERARASAPCVIFFDELDSLAPNRGKNGDSGGVMDRVVSQLLAEIDGVESSGSVFIIGATNRPDLIDPALLRPGRFDKLLYVGISSDKKSQLDIVKALTRRFEFQENGTEIEDVVKELPDHLTGADIYAVCSNAWLFAVRRSLKMHKRVIDGQDSEVSCNISNSFIHKVVVTKEDFLNAALNLIPSVSKEELKRYENLRLELSPASR